MAKLSEETIEQVVISKEKPNLKISRKNKNNKVTENTTTIDIISESETVTSKKQSTKRTIKDITPKSTEKKQVKNSEKPEKKEEENQTSIKANTTKKAKRTKRTLHLNIEKTCSEKEEPLSSSISHAVDTSINQNSPFFYEPSVFEKFNICITSIDDNDSNINSNIETDQNEIADIELSENSETETNEITNTESSDILEIETNEVTDTKSSDILETETNEVADTESSDILETEINEVADTESSDILETETNEVSDTESNDILETEQNEVTDTESSDILETETNEVTDTESNDILETEQNEITDIELSENLETETLELDDLIDLIELDESTEQNDDIINIEDEISLNDLLELDNSDNIIELDSTEDITKNLSEDNIVLESADSTIEEINQTLKEVSSNPIGKFFNSSIPSLNSNDSSNTKFEKLKKSIFTNISPIFKRFTFEEANIVMNSNNTTDIQENLINDTNSYLDSIPENIIEQNLVGNSDFENEFEFSAKNTTIDIPKTKNDSILENPSATFDIDYSKIITPESNKSDTISIDDEIIDELINNSDFIDNDFEDELVNDFDDDIENDLIIDELDDLDNIEDLDLDLEEKEYNDDNFSIESYFGLDKLTDEDFAEIDFNKSSTQKEEPIEASNNIDEEPEYTVSPEEFVEKFLNDNEISDTSDNINIENESSNTELLEDLDTLEILENLDSLDNLDTLDLDTQNEDSNETENNSNTITEEATTLNSENIENITTENKKDTNNTITEELTTDANPIINGSEFTKLLESFNQTISTLSDRIANLEAEKLKIINDFEKTQNQTILENDNASENINLDTQVDSEELTETEKNEENNDNLENSEDIITENLEINLNDLDIEDLDLSDVDIDTLDLENEIDNLDIEITTDDEPSLYETNDSDAEKIVEDLFENNIELDEEIENALLSEVLEQNNLLETTENNNNEASTNSKLNQLDDAILEDFLLENIYEEDLKKLEIKTENVQTINHFAEMSEEYTDEPLSDFLTLIDSISKTIEDLENSPDIKNAKKENKNDLPTELAEINDKAINILINKDDIFSISILNETYEIVADFDGISVISENIHISTPKNNFFVKVGDKYIEIHNKKDNFVVLTNFEDVEFTNAINNVAFAKKHNKIELNIKEAFKLSSINNKIELSMLNTSIANMTNTSSSQIDESSICDNRTLLISEETQKVYLPYTIEEVMKKLASNNEYQTPKDVIENEYTLPLSTFKMPVISRFKEAYRFMRIKEKSSVYAAVDLGLELMFNSNLNPAVIRAAKDLKELNIYLDCLYENEVDKFDCFKIVYKVLPKIQ